MRKLTMTVATLLLAAGVQAAEVGGIKLDDKASVGGQELVLNGGGVRTRAVFKVYVGSLYVPAKTNNTAGVLAKGPRRIQLNLLRNLTADQLVDALTEGIKDNTTADELAAMKPQVDQMVTTMKAFNDVKEKDVVTLDFVGGATKIGLNGAEKGSIAGEPFNRALTRIWIGDKPAQADLKQAMLGS
jgi:hypothetical protein